MIYFFSDRSLAKYSINAFFNTEVASLLDSEDKNIIETFDKSTFLDDITLKTRFGVCGVADISTGAKALICIRHFPDIIWDISECGVNATFEMSNFDFDFKITMFSLPCFHNNVKINWDGIIYNDWNSFADAYAKKYDF